MTDACTRESAERMEAEAKAALPKALAEALGNEITAAWSAGYMQARGNEAGERSSREREREARAALDAAILSAIDDERCLREAAQEKRNEVMAESEARRLVLVLKATELRQEWLRAERAEEVVRWLAGCYRSTLGGRSVRDADEALAAADAILSPLPAPQPAPKVKP